MILPATIGDGTPRAIPMLINARPTVPTVPHAPMANETSPQVNAAVIRKYFGVMILRP